MSAVQLQPGSPPGQEPAIPGRPVAADSSCSQTAAPSTGGPNLQLRCASPTSTEDVDNGGKCTARLAQLFNNPKFSDIALVVDGHRFYAHKLLLANASDVFE